MDAGFSTADTIVAVATPPGRGGLGVVRLSGAQSTSIVEQLTTRSTPFVGRQATLTHIESASGSTIDQVVVTRFPAPHSYTGEDVVEISGHGSPWLLQQIVDLACGLGARLAQPGEFTLRAYLNERLDLVQAEAVADLVHAVTPLQARMAMDQLEGTLTTAVGDIESQVFDLAAKLEASLDFPDEGFHFVTRQEVTHDLGALEAGLSKLLADGRKGRLVREGRTVVIAGRPNVGKSSLFNALVGVSRAIVTPLAGTTRDVLTEQIDVQGVPVTLVDTAGVRESVDAIEAEGVRRAEQARGVAALTLLVLDGSEVLTDDDDRLLGHVTGPTLVVINKSDRRQAWSQGEVASTHQGCVHVSASTAVGLEELRSAIVRTLSNGDDWRETPMVSNQRHIQQLEHARTAVTRARTSLGDGATEELVLAELGEARQALETVTGRRTADELLHHVFSRFCIGK